ncbi:hypothetical protein HDU97_008494 [Phlyctochytrium planicorne]|nr:hypothetical protein HDU97_008494 [Phlyctochytrium planicorne]
MPVVSTRNAIHRHVPLIKFLGAARPRTPHQTVASPVVQKPASTASSSPNVTKVIYYETSSAVPNSFRARPLSEQEINTILYGGAIWEEKPVKPPKKK